MTKHQQILSLLPVQLNIPIAVNADVRIYELEKNENEILVRIGDGTWHQLEEKDHNYESVADAILNRLYDDLPRSKDYMCPNCQTWHNDSDTGYEVDGVHLPIYRNEVKGSNMDGMYHNWDEIHKCENCKSMFWFRSGGY